MTKFEKIAFGVLLFGAAAALPLCFTPVGAQPMPTCSPGQSCKVLSISTTKTTGAGVSIGGDAGVRFGDGTIMNTAPTSFSGNTGNLVLDGGLLCFENTCATSIQADGGVAGVNMISGIASKAKVLDDSSSNSAFNYFALNTAGTGCTTANIATWYAGTSQAAKLGCDQTFTASAILSSNDSIRSDQFSGRSSSGTAKFLGNKSDAAGSVAMALGNTGAFSTAGDQIVSLRNGSAASAEVGYILPSGLSSSWTQHPVTGSGKRLGEYTITLNTDTTFTATKLPSPSLLTAGVVASAPTADGTLNMIDYPTTAVSNNAAGIAGPYTVTRFDFRPRLTAVIRTGASVANTRIFVGLADADISGAATNAALNGNKVVAIRFDTALDSQWSLVTSDASTCSVTACSSTPPLANTTYIFDLDFTRSGGVVCRVNNGNSAGTNFAVKTTNLPTGATNIGIQVSQTTLSGTALDFYVGKVSLEQN